MVNNSSYLIAKEREGYDEQKNRIDNGRNFDDWLGWMCGSFRQFGW